MSTIREQRIELAGFGTRVLELEPDSPTGEPPLILLHGFSDSADCWRPTLAVLARRGRRAIALDLPGFGQAAHVSSKRDVVRILGTGHRVVGELRDPPSNWTASAAPS